MQNYVCMMCGTNIDGGDMFVHVCKGALCIMGKQGKHNVHVLYICLKQVVVKLRRWHMWYMAQLTEVCLSSWQVTYPADLHNQSFKFNSLFQLMTIEPACFMPTLIVNIW